MYEQAVIGELREGERLAIRGGDPTDIYCWRMEELERAGYSAVVADVLATHPEVDLHLACDLLARGCSERLAYSILL
jgi:hypothetical protein